MVTPVVWFHFIVIVRIDPFVLLREQHIYTGKTRPMKSVTGSSQNFIDDSIMKDERWGAKSEAAELYKSRYFQ